MTHRRSRASAAALLTMILSLALCAGAWAQGGDEPVSSDDPTLLEPRTGEEGTVPATGSEGSGSDQCPGARSSLNARTGECERDRDCENFTFQEEAQRFYISRGGPEEDDHDLNRDSNEDDQACEELPSENDGGGDSDDEGTPSGGIDSGFGPVTPAPETDAPLPLGLVGAGLGVLGLVGLGVARLRRAG